MGWRSTSPAALAPIRRRGKLLDMAKPLAKLVSLLTPKRRWTQFRLRTLYVLVAVAALPCVWLAWRMEHKRRERAVVAEIKKQGGVVFYDWQTTGNDTPSGAAWLRTLLGDDFFADVTCVIESSQVTDADLTHLQGLTALQKLHLNGTKVTDEGLSHLEGFRGLQALFLDGTDVTDAGLTQFKKRFTALRYLGLSGTKATDAGVAELQNALPKCKIAR